MEKKNKKIYDFVVEYTYNYVNEYFWEELWESFKRGGLRKSIEERFGKYDPYEEYELLWEGKQHPFLVELDILLDKYKPIFKKLEYKPLDEILNGKGKEICSLPYE